jgi:hypothetical protein
MGIGMLQKVRAFLAREDGAVTADWVVLTAGIVMAVTAGLFMIRAEAIDSIAKIFFWVEQSGI